MNLLFKIYKIFIKLNVVEKRNFQYRFLEKWIKLTNRI